MHINEITAQLEMTIVSGDSKTEVLGAYTSDLLSDVMAHANEGDVLITIQAHRNAVAVASHVDIPAVIVCNDRPVPDEMLEAGNEHGIAICTTPLSQYEVSGRLYTLFAKEP